MIQTQPNMHRSNVVSQLGKPLGHLLLRPTCYVRVISTINIFDNIISTQLPILLFFFKRRVEPNLSDRLIGALKNHIDCIEDVIHCNHN